MFPLRTCLYVTGCQWVKQAGFRTDMQKIRIRMNEVDTDMIALRKMWAVLVAYWLRHIPSNCNSPVRLQQAWLSLHVIPSLQLFLNRLDMFQPSDWWNVTIHLDEHFQHIQLLWIRQTCSEMHAGSSHAWFPHPTRLTSMVLSNEPTLFLRPRFPVTQSEWARVKICSPIKKYLKNSLKTKHAVSGLLRDKEKLVKYVHNSIWGQHITRGTAAHYTLL